MDLGFPAALLFYNFFSSLIEVLESEIMFG